MTTKRVALVTGGTRGIGLGIARALARDGWTLALCGLRSREEVADVVNEIASLGGGAEYLGRRHRQPERPRAIAAVDRRALRNAARARQQRRPRAARAGRSARRHGGELRRGAAYQSAGPVLSDAGGRAVARSTTGGRERTARDRVRDVGLGRDGVAAARRVLCEQGGTLDGCQIICGSSRVRSVFRCTRCVPASSPQT